MNSEDKTVGQAAREYSKSFKKGTFFEACLRREAFKKGVKWHASQFKSKDNIPSLSEDKTLLDLAANIIHDCNEYIGANLVNGEIEQFFTRYKQLKDNIPEPDRIAELENQNEALARNLAELQVMYGEAKAKLNAIPEPDSQWISVEDRLPDVREKVWIATEHYQTTGCFLKEDEYGIIFKELGADLPRYNFVTHWMPLPSPPVIG